MKNKIKIYLDTADIKKIVKAKNNKNISGFTTNPSLLRKNNIKSYQSFIKYLCKKVSKPISFEIFADDEKEIINQSIKISKFSKNILVKLKNGEEKKYKDLLIKSMKCKNSEFDDNPEIIAYIQVRDLTNKDKDNVFVFNGWMFSSSPSITPFDHPVYDIWLVSCY